MCKIGQLETGTFFVRFFIIIMMTHSGRMRTGGVDVRSLKLVFSFLAPVLTGIGMLLPGCGDENAGGDGNDPLSTDEAPWNDENLEDGLDELPSAEATRYAALMAEYEATRDMSADTFAEQYAVPFVDGLDYDPLTASNLSLLQESPLALGEDALATLGENGFVILEDFLAPTFFNAYERIYEADLPVYISADSILDAIHRSYDNILKEVEGQVLINDLENLLTSMRASLADADAGAAGEEILRDLDVYLTVPLVLLTEDDLSPVRGGDSGTIASFVNKAQGENGMETIALFGVERLVDFSQFKPRGHYDDWQLSNYFKAMMWLGRFDFRLVETDPLGERHLNRRQVAAMLAIADLMSAKDKERWARIDDTLKAFVGESDNMTIEEIPALLTSLGVSDPADLDSVDDETLKETILGGGFGTQRICSHLMVNGMDSGTLPLNASFLLFGQRYVLDSHVFSNLVYSRVQGGEVYRMMPDPLDVAFAVLDNDQAAALLTDEIDTYGYAPDLHMSRTLVEAHGDTYWKENLYNLWLDTLRALSPQETVANPAAAGLSTLFGTEPWGRRILNTQLGSWAELRHDTLLLAKQSYSDMPGCAFPEAYVDPYPEFFEAVARFADKGLDIAAIAGADAHDYLGEYVTDYFNKLGATAEMLKEMAEQQRDGVPFTEEQLAFVNDAIYVGERDVDCAMVPWAYGWYTELFFMSDYYEPFERDPTVADVHTQPADEAGNPVGRVLHVAVGEPRTMVVTANTCEGPRAYVGPVFSYFEKITEDFERLTDEQWAEELQSASQTDVPWMRPVISR